MPREQGTPEQLAGSMGPRVASSALEIHERYVTLLRLAQHIRHDSGFPANGIENLVAAGVSELATLSAATGGRVTGRKKPKDPTRNPAVGDCLVFIDECGNHNLAAKEKFGAFVLAAVIVPESLYGVLNEKWQSWKQSCLGSALKLVHEPDIRNRNKSFWIDGNRAKQDTAIASLTKVIPGLTFSAMAVVIDRARYVALHGEGRLDLSLPDHTYLMALHFLAERLVMVLEEQYGGARGRVMAEARGPLEDARLQYEFARLHLTGTSYVSDSWFRYQLYPWVQFKDKHDNETGLQLADLLARPCGEKAIDPSSTPPRWPEFRRKLCRGIGTQNSILGLKILPWDDAYANLWES